jgi:hypothetical protein
MSYVRESGETRVSVLPTKLSSPEALKINAELIVAQRVV